MLPVDSPFNYNDSGAIDRQGLFESATDPLWSGIANGLADACDVPIALITVLNSTTENVRASVGIDQFEWPCEQGLLQIYKRDSNRPLHHSNVLADPQYADHPLILGGQAIGFYSGSPITAHDGELLGFVLVADTCARSLGGEQRAILNRLIELVIGLTRLRTDGRSRGLIRSLAESIDQPLAVTIPDLPENPFIFCNAAYCDLSGYRSCDLLGQSCQVLQGLGTDPIAVSALQTNLLLGRFPTTTILNYRRDGTPFWNELTTIVDRDQNGRVAHIVWIAKDVTEQISFQSSSSELVPALAEANEPIVAYRFDSGQVIYANDNALRTFGYDREEILTLFAEDIVSGLTHESWRELTRPIREGTIELMMRHTIARRSDGSTFPVESKTQRGVLGRRDAIVAFFYDNTAKQSIETIVHSGVSSESDLRRTRRNRITRARREIARELSNAKSTNKEKSFFLAAASHDLRQPLQAMSLNLSLLEESIETVNAQSVADAIRDSIDTMDDLLKGLLDLSRFDSGAATAQVSCFALQDVLDRIRVNNEPQARRKNLEFRCAATSAIVDSDPILLERLIENLVSNAIRYTHTGGVSIEVVSVANKFRISVVDSGVGIPVESLSTIFEEYQQLETGTTNCSKGLGLGLAFVERVSRMLDHPVTVSSIVGQGSSFSVDVPAGVNSEPVPPEGSVSSSDDHMTISCKLLYVEDNDLIASPTMALLRANGIEVRAASDVNEALSAVSDDDFVPNLILTDYRLSGASGLEVIRRIREATNSEMPAIVLTGDANSSELNERLPERCRLILKPIRINKLLLTIGASLDASAA